MTTVALKTSELTERWLSLGAEERLELFQSLPRSEGDDFFLDLTARDQAELIRAMPLGERRLWLRLLAPDDAADLVQEFEPRHRDEILRDLDESTRSEVRGLLAYKEDVAGGRMSPRFARLRPDSTVDEAIAYLRRQAPEVETIYYAYAVDDEQHLLGVVSFRDLFAADRTKRITDVMRTRFLSVPETADQEAVARLFRQHHLLAIPVLDEAQHIKGIVTIDDTVSVFRRRPARTSRRSAGRKFSMGRILKSHFWRWYGSGQAGW